MVNAKKMGINGVEVYLEKVRNHTSLVKEQLDVAQEEYDLLEKQEKDRRRAAHLERSINLQKKLFLLELRLRRMKEILRVLKLENTEMRFTQLLRHSLSVGQSSEEVLSQLIAENVNRSNQTTFIILQIGQLSELASLGATAV